MLTDPLASGMRPAGTRQRKPLTHTGDLEQIEMISGGDRKSDRWENTSHSFQRETRSDGCVKKKVGRCSTLKGSVSELFFFLSFFLHKISQ